MSVPIANRARGGLRHWVAQVWQAWRRRRRTLAEIGDPDELGHIARDIGLSRSEVCILAGKWPDSLDLLSKRLDQVELDGPGLRQASPQVLRDLQRTCGLCESKRRCSHDFASNPAGARWQEYCPNAVTIHALLAERFNPVDASRL